MRISIEVLKEIEQRETKFLNFIFCTKFNVLITKREFEDCNGLNECKGYCWAKAQEYSHGKEHF